MCANQTSCRNHNDFPFIDVDLLPPKLKVTPAEVNLRSDRSVCVMYTNMKQDRHGSPLTCLRNVRKGLMSHTFHF